MQRTLQEVQALADEHGLDAFDIQRTADGWSVVLAAVDECDDGHPRSGMAADRGYGEGPTLDDAVAAAEAELVNG